MKTVTEMREFENEKKKAAYLHRQAVKNDADYMLSVLRQPLDRLIPDIAEGSFSRGFEEGYKRREEHERLEELRTMPNTQEEVLQKSRKAYTEVMLTRYGCGNTPTLLFLSKKKAVELYPFLKTMINGWSIFDIVSEANIGEKLKSATLADAKICLTENFETGWRWA